VSVTAYVSSGAHQGLSATSFFRIAGGRLVLFASCVV
jgi:hypothetical protein